MTAAEIYLVRHAEADGADADDPGLSSRGRDQAMLVGSRISGACPVAVLHSPRLRAVQTAAIIAASVPGVPVSASDLLDDRTPVPSPQRRDEYPPRYLPWLDDTAPDEQDIDGATLSQAMDELVSEALRRAEDGPLVLVTHAFVIGWFVRAALDAPVWRWLGLHPTNTSVTVVRYGPDGTSNLVTFNDDSHLR